MEIKATFIGVGAFKTGSRSIMSMLTRYNKVLAPTLANTHSKTDIIFNMKLKELHFFEKDNFDENDFRDYNNFFKGDNKPQGEWSSYYIQSNKILDRIKKYNENIKILYLVRDPIKRIWSEYRFLRLKNPYFLDDEHKSKRLIDFLKEIEKSTPLIPFSDEYYFLKKEAILYNGMYYDHYKRLCERFPKENIHIISLEEMKLDPLKVINKAITFLGGDELKRIKEEHRVKTQVQRDISELREAEPFIKEFYKDEMKKFYEHSGIDYRFE
jgi:hypothetical protein